jgi:hypothetical protein
METNNNFKSCNSLVTTPEFNLDSNKLISFDELTLSEIKQVMKTGAYLELPSNVAKELNLSKFYAFK